MTLKIAIKMVASSYFSNGCTNFGRNMHFLKVIILKSAASEDYLVPLNSRYSSCPKTFQCCHIYESIISVLASRQGYTNCLTEC